MSLKAYASVLVATVLLVACSLSPFGRTATAAGAPPAPVAAPGLVTSGAADAADLTIYGSRLTQVQEVRTVRLASGQVQIQLDGIASQYRPDSLRIVEVSGPGKFTYRSSTYQGANLTPERVIEASVGKEIEVFHQPTGLSVSGKLLAVSGNSLVLALPTGDVRVLPAGDVRLLSTPVGLSNSASLVVEAEVSRAGVYKVKFMYEAGGFSWSAKHNVVLNEGASKLDSWQTIVSVVNNSGVAYKNATVRLMSGAAAGTGDDEGRDMYKASGARAMAGESAPVVDSVGDQKSYVLPGTVTLEQGQTRQIQLFEAHDVPVVREYFVPAYGGGDKPTSVSVRLTVENCAKHNMGQPLPAGMVKVYQTGSSGVQQQTGSARMGDKAADEVFDLVIGTASDIKFTRTLVEQKELAPATPPAPVRPGSEPAVYEEQTWEVKVFNYKSDRDVKVAVEVAVPADQDVQPLVKKSAGVARGELQVGKTGNKTLRFTYKVRVR